jgi:hypothetical protein
MIGEKFRGETNNGDEPFFLSLDDGDGLSQSQSGDLMSSSGSWIVAGCVAVLGTLVA